MNTMSNIQQEFSTERKLMVAQQLRARQISDSRVLEAFESIPRHLFVPKEYQASAYEDHPYPIDYEQTISQPYIVAYMIQSLGLMGNQRILEVGTGSGYQTAILSHLAAEVHSIEVIEPLAKRAAYTLSNLGIKNVFIHIGDGSLGWEQASPYHAIIVSAAAPAVPNSLLKQLAHQGRLILPVGESGNQHLELWTRENEDFSYQRLLPVSFVPLKGQEGF